MDEEVTTTAVDTSAVDTSTGSGSTDQQQVSINPAWNDLLGAVPDSFHPLITPHLRKWDENFSKVQTGYEPFKAIVDQGYSAEDIQNAVNVFNVLNSNPRAVYDRMVESFGEEWGLNSSSQQVQPPVQGLGNSTTVEEMDFAGIPGIENDPKFQELLANQQVLANYLYTQQEAQNNAAADAALDAEIKQLTNKYGTFDEQYVLSLAANGMSLEQAVMRYSNMVNDIRSRPSAGSSIPSIMPASGSMPSNKIDVTSLNDEQRRGLALSFIKTQREG